jgi:hypothetical protein
VAGSCEHGSEISGSMKGDVILDHLISYCFVYKQIWHVELNNAVPTKFVCSTGREDTILKSEDLIVG